jgi:hypothetical protein
MPINFPTDKLTNGDVFLPLGIPGAKYVYNAAKNAWIGTGGTGYTGSTGLPGEPGSPGFVGSTGFVGSQGILGYTGSIGVGYAGSVSTVAGYTGSAGSGSSVTSAAVGTAIAGLAAGDIGTYVYAVPNLIAAPGINASIALGSTVAGSRLMVPGGLVFLTPYVGTWRAMTPSPYTVGFTNPDGSPGAPDLMSYALWMRIS